MLSAGEFDYGTARCLWAIKPTASPQEMMGLYFRVGLTSSSVAFAGFQPRAKFVFAFTLTGLVNADLSVNGSAWVEDVPVADGAGDYAMGEGWVFSSSYSPDAHSFIGYCRAILVYNKVLAPSELQQIMRYYGVPANPS
jgi:hypothetical protein